MIKRKIIKIALRKMRFLATAVLFVILSACAAPATKAIKISDAEIRREQQTQTDMAKRFPAKPIVRKHKELSIYKQRLQRVAAPLANAAKKLCRTGTCSYKFDVVDKKGLGAWTDGKSVVFTPEMMDFVETDKELATVIAHELAHNVMGHHAKQQQNIIFGTLIDIAAAAGGGIQTGGIFGNIGSMSYSQGFENEADYVGIYIMALAGHDISNVHLIWRKMTMQTGQGTQASFFSSHPSNPERYIRMQRTIEEVQIKKKLGKKLIPNYTA